MDTVAKTRRALPADWIEPFEVERINSSVRCKWIQTAGEKYFPAEAWCSEGVPPDLVGFLDELSFKFALR